LEKEMTEKILPGKRQEVDLERGWVMQKRGQVYPLRATVNRTL